jgi:hypothetical protein
MHEYDIDLPGDCGYPKQTNQGKLPVAIVTSVVADSSARLDMICTHGSSGPLAALPTVLLHSGPALRGAHRSGNMRDKAA